MQKKKILALATLIVVAFSNAATYAVIGANLKIRGSLPNHVKIIEESLKVFFYEDVYCQVKLEELSWPSLERGSSRRQAFYLRVEGPMDAAVDVDVAWAIGKFPSWLSVDVELDGSPWLCFPEFKRIQAGKVYQVFIAIQAAENAALGELTWHLDFYLATLQDPFQSD